MDGSDAPDRALVELADAVLALAHQLELRGHAARNVAPLTGSEVTVLREVRRQPGVTATRIAAVTGSQRSYVSALAHALEQRDLLERCDAVEGGRGVGFRLTPRALEEYRLVERYWVERLRAAPEAVLAGAAGVGRVLDEIARAVAESGRETTPAG